MKVYVTKYALTDGIYECEIDENRKRRNTRKTSSIAVKNFRARCLYKSEYSLDANIAIEMAEKMRDKKIKYLQKQIDRIKMLEFNECGIIKLKE